MAEKKATPKKETMAAEAKAAEVKTEPKAETNLKGISIQEKLQYIQERLKAPKNQKNKHFGYSYRNLEDITGAAKPLAADVGVSITFNDEVVEIANSLFVKSTAVLSDGNAEIKTQAFAGVAKASNRMDESQVIGSASSYARKYAANGLFAIDDSESREPDEVAGSQEWREQRNRAQNEKVICPKCNGEVKAARGRSGAVLTAQQVRDELRTCSDCFRAAQENKPDVMTGRELAEQQAAQNG